MPTRTPLLAGNWKMHGSVAEAIALVDGLIGLIRDVSGREALVAPPFTALAPVAQKLAGTKILLAGQNMHWEEKGAFTGEVSGPMLREVGCTHVILGHSERRQFFGETDDSVAQKVRAALKYGLVPIVCVGELLAEREANRTLAVIDSQIRGALEGLSAADFAKIVIAHEPVWAIGTGKVATPDQAQEVHATIRRIAGELVGANVAGGVRILYGGSVKPDNVDELMRQPDVDGALVGGASLKAADFARIVRFQS